MVVADIAYLNAATLDLTHGLVSEGVIELDAMAFEVDVEAGETRREMKGRVYTADVGTAAPSAIDEPFGDGWSGSGAGRIERRGVMYPLPDGPDETPEQIRELDDTLLSSDPLGYFMSRIGMLHHWASCGARQAAGDDEADAAADLNDVAIGRPDINALVVAVFRNAAVPGLPPMVVSAQVAVDAFALRHHLAEALLRLFIACADAYEAEADDGGTPMSLWARLTDDRERSVEDLLKRVRHVGKSMADDTFSKLVLPFGLAVTEDVGPRAVATVETFASWLEYAHDLLRPSEIDTTSAHNKVKHGLAVRGRSDLKLSFSTIPPDADGNVGLWAFADGNVVDLFDRSVLEFLARPPKKNKVRQGLELTQLKLDYRVILSEAAMLAFVHGALFNVAACRHFAGRTMPNTLSIAKHPGLVSEVPKPYFAGHQVGLRYPITTAEDGRTARPAGIAHQNGMWQTLTFTGEKTTGRVVDDWEDPPIPDEDDN